MTKKAKNSLGRFIIDYFKSTGIMLQYTLIFSTIIIPLALIRGSAEGNDTIHIKNIAMAVGIMAALVFFGPLLTFSLLRVIFGTWARLKKIFGFT
jgi:hypothetical protein